jgi:hypothetical protein
VQFVHSALTWGFLLALLPLLIHLINMMRHRRVKWAAMEFLLASYKKHRKWVWLKQLLLLLARMAVVALAVAMLAQLKTRDQWLAIFGGRVTHHYVVLDDSYSMQDRVAGESATDAAKRVLAAIVGRAKQQDSPQKLTLIRYSQARGLPPLGEGRGEGLPPLPMGEGRGEGLLADQVADFNAEPIDSQFDVTLERKIRGLEATQLSLGPLEALGMLRQLLTQAKDETSIVYLLSDFRQKDWGSPTELRDVLGQLRRSQAEIHLVNCAKSSEPNLGILSIEPADETRAAGVPLFVNATIKNFGTRPASKVQLKLQATFYPSDNLAATQPEELKGQVDDLATLLIDQIDPGESLTRRVQVYFAQPGKHVVEASLPEDPVLADNHRWCVIDFPEGERVLVVDGTDEKQQAYYLEAAFRPLERSNTGIRPDVKEPAFLRDATLEALNAYSAIYLLDVPRLDGKAAETLDAYVRGGGGLAVFAGAGVSTSYYNQTLYRDGQGWLPAPLGVDVELPPALDAGEPDLELSSHPIFSFFLGETNPLIRGVKIDRYRRVADNWKPGPAQAVEVIARTRDKTPLVVEKKHGLGAVLLFLTTLAPDWNDWAKNPSFVVVVLKTQSYLATAHRLDDPRLVGTPLDLRVEAAKYRTDVAFVVPGEKASSRQKIDRQLSAESAPATTALASLGQLAAGGQPRGETDRAGVYEAWPITAQGEIDLRRWAFNVDPAEGDLTPIPPADLTTNLDPVKVNYHLAEQYQQEDVASTGYNLSTLLLFGLILLLVGEQVLAYSASYHVQPGAAR